MGVCFIFFLSKCNYFLCLLKFNPVEFLFLNYGKKNLFTNAMSQTLWKMRQIKDVNNLFFISFSLLCKNRGVVWENYGFLTHWLSLEWNLLKFFFCAGIRLRKIGEGFLRFTYWSWVLDLQETIFDSFSKINFNFPQFTQFSIDSNLKFSEVQVIQTNRFYAFHLKS